MASCWICGEQADRWNHPEARLCEGCWERSVGGLRALDFGLVKRSGGNATIEVEAPPVHAPTIQLVFRAESYGSIVKKLIKKELQVGRPHVDDQVYFEYADEADLPLLQSYEVSELMAELSKVGTVEVSDSRALIHVQQRDPDEDQIALLAASLLHFLSARQNR